MNVPSISRPENGTGPLGAGSFQFLEVPDDARIVVLEDRDLEPLPEWERDLVRYGGLNRFGAPNYRIVWGWKRWNYYPVNLRSYFHLERWMPPETFGFEEDWEAENKRLEAREPLTPLYPFPAKGEYFWIHTCRLSTRKPTLDWIYDALILSRLKMNRTRKECREEARAQHLHQQVIQRNGLNRVLDDQGVSEIIEDYVRHRRANPSEWKGLNPLV